jgi:hypothetical protein
MNEKAIRAWAREEQFCFCFGNYNALLCSLVPDGGVVLKVDDNGYQGDSRVLFEQRREFGFLIFGWGSCSSCDALQHCESEDDVVELAKTLEHGIIWKESAEEMLKYLTEKDWSLDYHGGSKATKAFLEAAKMILLHKIEGW